MNVRLPASIWSPNCSSLQSRTSLCSHCALCPPGNLISHIFRENEVCRDAEWERYFCYKNIEVPEIYSGPHLTFPLTVEQVTGLVDAFRNKKVGATLDFRIPFLSSLGALFVGGWPAFTLGSFMSLCWAEVKTKMWVITGFDAEKQGFFFLTLWQ